jgi:vacuolar protein sorting-associated protein 13A/C
MTISMATLEFFCNRPTVVALIDFGSEISEILDRQSNVPDNSKESDILSNDVRPLVECEVVRGLLGHGKSRIVFQLKMNMDSLCIFLNLEDGTGLAMLDQERFHMDLKVRNSII